MSRLLEVSPFLATACATTHVEQRSNPLPPFCATPAAAAASAAGYFNPSPPLQQILIGLPADGLVIETDDPEFSWGDDLSVVAVDACSGLEAPVVSGMCFRLLVNSPLFTKYIPLWTADQALTFSLAGAISVVVFITARVLEAQEDEVENELAVLLVVRSLLSRPIRYTRRAWSLARWTMVASATLPARGPPKTSAGTPSARR